jgi:hypothetical protein
MWKKKKKTIRKPCQCFRERERADEMAFYTFHKSTGSTQHWPHSLSYSVLCLSGRQKRQGRQEGMIPVNSELVCLFPQCNVRTALETKQNSQWKLWIGEVASSNYAIKTHEHFWVQNFYGNSFPLRVMYNKQHFNFQKKFQWVFILFPVTFRDSTELLDYKFYFAYYGNHSWHGNALGEFMMEFENLNYRRRTCSSWLHAFTENANQQLELHSCRSLLWVTHMWPDSSFIWTIEINYLAVNIHQGAKAVLPAQQPSFLPNITTFQNSHYGFQDQSSFCSDHLVLPPAATVIWNNQGICLLKIHTCHSISLISWTRKHSKLLLFLCMPCITSGILSAAKEHSTGQRIWTHANL